MFVLRYLPEAEEIINDIISSENIYTCDGHFTQEFLNWNNEFHRYVNKETISKLNLPEHDVYDIGTIGKLDYLHFTIEDDEIFVILEFRFSKLPYKQKKQQYKVVGNAGYKHKIIQSTFNHKYSILTPQRKYLTKFVFDEIIGFHHSSNDFNTIYAIGFQENRVFAIYQDGKIEVLPYSKEEYLNKKHKYYESNKPRKMVINESYIREIIRETLRRYLQL